MTATEARKITEEAQLRMALEYVSASSSRGNSCAIFPYFMLPEVKETLESSKYGYRVIEAEERESYKIFWSEHPMLDEHDQINPNTLPN